MSIGASGPLEDLGPAKVTWGTTVLDTYEEVKFTLTGESADVFENVYGATPVDSIFLGYSECTALVPATRLTLGNLQKLLPGGSISGSGLVRTNSDIAVGISHYDKGHPLIIQPIIDGVASTTKGLRLERVYPVPNFEISFNLTAQRVYAITFKAHPDSTGILWSAGAISTADYS